MLLLRFTGLVVVTVAAIVGVALLNRRNGATRRLEDVPVEGAAAAFEVPRREVTLAGPSAPGRYSVGGATRYVEDVPVEGAAAAFEVPRREVTLAGPSAPGRYSVGGAFQTARR